MKSRGFRWFCLVLCVAFMVKSIVGVATVWSVAGFFGFGILWYWLTWRSARKLDAPRPR